MSSRHTEAIMNSALYGCFNCLSTFKTEEISAWTDDKQTALCPKCGIVSALGSASGYLKKGQNQQLSRHYRDLCKSEMSETSA